MKKALVLQYIAGTTAVISNAEAHDLYKSWQLLH